MIESISDGGEMNALGIAMPLSAHSVKKGFGNIRRGSCGI